MNNRKRKFSLRERLESFRHAFHGLASLVAGEHNFRIHLAAAVIVIATGILLGVSRAEWLILIISITVVLVAEAINSAFEKICDIVSPGKDIHIKKAKDILAAAVLIAAIMAVIIGLIIFIPYLLALFLQ